MKKTAIVAAVHIQPSKEWIEALVDIHCNREADIIIVDDSNGKVRLPFGFDIHDYEKQRGYLGSTLYKQFEQFHHSSACKNYGMWYAYREGYDYVIVIDSDCIVSSDFVSLHLSALETKGVGWENPLAGTGFYSRGFPFSKRNIERWTHMGLWTNELDLYGIDRIGEKNIPIAPPETIEAGTRRSIEQYDAAAFFPLSGMNVSFKREAVPYMLFLPNFSHAKEHFTRHDDIWGGYIFQKIAHAKNKSLSYGLPYVEHDTVVVPEEDARAESAMIKYEDAFYKTVDSHPLFTNNCAKNFNSVAIFFWFGEWFQGDDVFSGLAPAFRFWAQAFDQI